MKLANRISRLKTEGAYEVLAKAKKLENEGKEIIHLEIGEPDFDTPKNIIKSAKKALDEGWTHYTPSAGLMEVRKCVAEHISKTRQIHVGPEEIVITVGAKPVLFYTLLALLEEGDEVLCPNPSYPVYESILNFLGAKIVPILIREEQDFNFDVSELEKLLTTKTKLLILNSPANPTGGVLTASDMEKIVAILKKFPEVMVFSDEIYSEIIYEGTHISIASFPEMKERTVILDGLSKTFAMTGWRLGYGVCPKYLAPAITKLAMNSVSCASAFGQIAMIEALSGEKSRIAVRKMVKEFKKRRDVIVRGLNEIPGFSCKLPKGAFYVFPNIQNTRIASQELADMILNETGVACLSGTCFGKYGEGYLRFSYANSVENINKALEKIKTLSHKWT